MKNEMGFFSFIARMYAFVSLAAPIGWFGQWARAGDGWSVWEGIVVVAMFVLARRAFDDLNSL